jgi:nitrous oxide reductase accessory protein NosL
MGENRRNRGRVCSRRRVLGAAGAVGVAAFAGCTGGSGAAPSPVTVDPEATCDVCGMVVAAHPGPSSEVFYAENRPAGHANPARFDSTWEAFRFDFERDWTREAFYVTDYSTTAYEVRTDGETELISRHTAAETFIDATTATFVADSAVQGTMGADLLGFSAREDAERFRADHGGDLVTFDEVSRTLIGQLGR